MDDFFSRTLEIVGRRGIGLSFMKNVGPSFLKIGMTFTILSLTGNTHVFMTWLIIKDLMIAGSIIFKNFEEMLSNPLLFFVGRSFIIFLIVSSLTFSNLRIDLTYVFK